MRLLTLLWFLRLALMRLAAQWRSILTIIAGVLLTTIIGASIPLYTAAIAQAGLTQHLDQQPTDSVNIFSRTRLNGNVPGGFSTGWARLDAAFVSAFNTQFGLAPTWLSQIVNWGESTPMFVLNDGVEIEGVRAQIAYYEGLVDHTSLLAGRLPVDAGSGDDAMEVVLSQPAAERFGVGLGDELILDQRGWESSRLVRVAVVGILQATVPDDAYWMQPSPLRVQPIGTRVDVNLLTTRANLERVAADFVPETSTQFGWRVLLDYPQVLFSEIEGISAGVTGLEGALDAAFRAAMPEDTPAFDYTTALPGVLAAYAADVAQLGAPFGILLFQLGGLVLFFLVVVGALVRRTDRREIAILQSRGAPDYMIMILRGLEALVICAGAVLLGPLLAHQLLRMLIPLFTGVDGIALVVEPPAYAYAAIAGLVALIVLMLSLLPVLRQPLVSTGSDTRTRGETWWQRYYLDMVLLVVGGAALWQLVNSGSAFTGSERAPAQVDPLLLLGPAFLLFAVGSVSLRFFPHVMDAGAHVLAGRRGLSGALAGWQLSREPLHYARITLLLALAISIGVFAISFQAALTRNQDERAGYAVGADVRLVFEQGRNPQPLPDDVAALEQVQQAVVVARLSDVSTVSQRLRDGKVLLVDGDALDAVAFWRDDLGSLNVPVAPELPQPGRVLPDGVERITVAAFLEGYPLPLFAGSESEAPGFGVQYERLRDAVNLALRLRDATGKSAVVPLVVADAAQMQDDGWLHLAGDVTGAGLQGDIRLDALLVSTRSGTFQNPFTSPSLLTLRDLTAAVDETEINLNDWLQAEDWAFVNEVAATQLDPALEEASQADVDEHTVLQTYWVQNADNGRWGLVLQYPEGASVQNAAGYDTELSVDEINAVPVWVSTTFAERSGLSDGQLFTLFLDQSLVWFRVERIVRYFPTVYDQQGAFLVADRDLLTYTLQRRPRSDFQANEIWVKLQPGATADEFVEAFSARYGETLAPDQVLTQSQAARDIQTDLLNVGIIGLLYFTFLVGMVLAIVSLLTYAGIAAQTRRSEFAVLRALGLSQRQVVLGITIEQLVVVVFGAVLGLLIGLFLSFQVLPTLPSASQTPPFRVQVEVAALGVLVLSLGLVFALQLLASWWIIAQNARSKTNSEGL